MQSFVGVVGVVGGERIVCVSRKKKRETILRIFRKITPKNIVAIFAASARVRKIAVYHVYAGERRTRNRFHKLPVLSKKRFSEIVISAVIERIPFVRIPTLAAINRKWVIRRTDADNRFAA